jgi:hypothetical protein
MNGPKKAFNAPTKLYYIQGLIYESDEDLFIKQNGMPKGVGKDDLPQIIQLSKSAGDALVKKLNKLAPDYTGSTDVDNQHQLYMYGDIVNLEAGMFLTVFNPDVHKNVSDYDEELESESSSNDDGFQSWGVALNPEFTYMSRKELISVPGDLTEHADIIKRRIVPWDDLLYFPADEEIALWMAQAFRSMPDLLQFGWADNPEFFTDEVHGVLASRTQVSTADMDSDEEEDVPHSVQRPKAQKAVKATPTKPVNNKVSRSVPTVTEELDDTDYDTEDDESPSETIVEETASLPEEDIDAVDDSSISDEVTDDLVDEIVDSEDDDISAEEEDAALAAVERAKMRTSATTQKVGPTGPPPSKAKVSTKTTPVRRQ